MSSVQKIFIACLVFLALSACGLKGDLYLPGAEPQEVGEKTETSKIQSTIPQESSEIEAKEPATKEDIPTL